MKINAKIMMSLLCIAIFLITGCTGKTAETARPPDFEFIFQYAGCGPVFTDILETARNTLTQNSMDGTTSTTTQLELTDQQLDLIYQKIADIDFFSYPTTFMVPDDQIRGYQAPFGIHKLTVINNSRTHSVTWTDEILTELPYRDEINLRELALMILQIIWSNPGYQPQIQCL